MIQRYKHSYTHREREIFSIVQLNIYERKNKAKKTVPYSMFQ